MELLWSLYFIDLGFRFLDLDFGFKFWIWIWTQIRSLDFRIWIWIQFEISFFGYEFKFSYVLSNTYIFYLIDFGIWIWDINRWWESKFCCSLSYWIVFLFCLQGRRLLCDYVWILIWDGLCLTGVIGLQMNIDVENWNYPSLNVALCPKHVLTIF